MKCLDHSVLQRYLDGELSAKKGQRVEKHLRDCPACSARYDAVKNRSQVLKTLLDSPMDAPATVPPLPSGIDGTFPVHHTQKTARDSKHPLLPQWAYWTSAACLIGSLFLLKPLVCQSQPHEMVYMYPEIVEVDANQPYQEQERELVIIESAENGLSR